jgi:hypothetical protein
MTRDQKVEYLEKSLKEISNHKLEIRPRWNGGVVEKHTIILDCKLQGKKFRFVRDTCICISPFPDELFVEGIEFLKQDLARQIREQEEQLEKELQ